MRYFTTFHLIQIHLILNMVAEVVICTGDGTSSKDSNPGTILGKAMAHATKLTDTNYTVWYAGILTVLVGFSGDPYEKLMKVLEVMKKHMQHSLTIIESKIVQEVLGKGIPEIATSKSSEEYQSMDKTVFQAVFATVSDSMEALKENLSTDLLFKGIAAVKYIHDNYGPGCGSMQVGKTMDMFTEKQKDSETAQQFGTRLSNMNASLTDKIQESMLKQIYLRGMLSHDCRKFCIRELSSNATMTFLQLINKANEFTVQDRMVNNIDGFNAPVRRNQNGNNNNRNINNRNNNNNRNWGGNNNRNNNNRFQGDCDFCKRPGHTWRQCFLLLVTGRPNNANHERMNARRDELLAQCQPVERQQYEDFMRRNNNNPGQNNVQAAQAGAELAFPNVIDGKMALAGPTIAQTVAQVFNFRQAMRLSIKLFKVVIALGMSCGGLIILLSVLMQATPSDAAVTPIQLKLPAHISLSHGVEAGQAIDAFPCSAVPARGMPWDSCAGLWLFNTTEPFHTWDKFPKSYRVNGAVGDACSQGTGRASVGFDDGSTITWFDNVFGVYVPQLAEPLAGATWSIANLGISTIMAPEGTFIRLPNGSVIPLSLEGNVTRCKHIILGRNAQPLRTPVPLLASPLAPFCDQTRRGQVSAKASNVVDATRGVPAEARGELLFKSWTRKCCGLAPESLARLSEATVGCPCPSQVPKQYKDLKWNSSAIAGKLRASSHPAEGHIKPKAFREYIATDFLEFKIGKRKFHGQAFIDYKVGLADMRCTPSRSEAPRGLLHFLNWTDPYTDGHTTVYCQMDRAAEHMSKEMKRVAIYSNVVTVLTAPYEHEQQGKVERFNQTIQRMVITVRHDSNIPDFLVVYAIDFCVYVYNRVPVESLDWKTRWEAATGQKPDVRGWHRFGCLCRVLKPLETRLHKFDTHAEDCVYLGRCPLGNGIRFYHLKKEVYES